MNWDALTFDWNQARAVLATVETGSLSAASRALGIAQPTVGRQVAALEDALGTVIFERVGKRLEVTDAGRDLIIHLQQMRDGAMNLSLTASGQSQELEGLVRITASDIYAVHVLPEFVAQLEQTAPGICIEIISSDAVQDLQRREADIALRHVQPTQPELFAKRIRTEKAYFYAAPSYLEKYGRPTSLASLAGHRFIGVDNLEMMLQYLHHLNMPVTKANFGHISANGLANWEMAKRGLGIVPIGTLLAAQEPNMEPILPDQLQIEFPIWLVVHRELRTSRRIRMVYDMLTEYLKKN